jgi:hypothetical protein
MGQTSSFTLAGAMHTVAGRKDRPRVQMALPAQPKSHVQRSTQSVEVGAMSGCDTWEKSENQGRNEARRTIQPHPRRQPASLLDVHAEPGEIPEKTKENWQGGMRREEHSNTASQSAASW